MATEEGSRKKLEYWLKYGVKSKEYAETTEADLALTREARLSEPPIRAVMKELRKVFESVREEI